jgi:hypothetical protein
VKIEGKEEVDRQRELFTVARGAGRRAKTVPFAISCAQAELAAPKPAKTSNRFDPAVLNLVNQELGHVLCQYPTHDFTGDVVIAGLEEQQGLRTRGTKLWNYVKELRQMPDTRAYRCYQ